VSGIGGCAGYAIGGVDWESVTGDHKFTTQLRVVFGIALAIHLICVLFAVTSFREIPLDELQANTSVNGGKGPRKPSEQLEVGSGADDAVDYGAVRNTETEAAESGKNSCTNGNDNTSFLTYARSIICLPKCVFWVCFSNFFLWMSLVTYAIYFTDFVGQAVYHGSPSAAQGSAAAFRYTEGVRLGSIAMAMYAASSSIYSLFIEKFIARFGKSQSNGTPKNFLKILYFVPILV
jgi:solute carrier family 45 protein 1/2/4